MSLLDWCGLHPAIVRTRFPLSENEIFELLEHASLFTYSDHHYIPYWKFPSRSYKIYPLRSIMNLERFSCIQPTVNYISACQVRRDGTLISAHLINKMVL